MSRIGLMPISVPNGVTVTIKDDHVSVAGEKGTIEIPVPQGTAVKQEDSILTVSRRRNDRKTKALHGLVRARIANAVTGVSKGWTRTLELHGVGYRASVSGQNLVMNLGFSHPVMVNPPEGIAFQVQSNKILVSGMNKQLVGQVAANIRKVKKPEPYKGKGIRYEGEHIRKKAGKAAKAVGGGA